MSYHKEIIPPYDLTLLSGVPVPISAERQEGNNVDSLDEGRNRRAPSPPVPNRQHTYQQPLTEGYGRGAAALAHKESQGDYGAGYPVAKRRWYRTRWGIIAIVIIIIIIIAAITGGAVGATHHSNHQNNSKGGEGNPNYPGPSGTIFTNPGPNTVVAGSNTVGDATAGGEITVFPSSPQASSTNTAFSGSSLS